MQKIVRFNEPDDDAHRPAATLQRTELEEHEKSILWYNGEEIGAFKLSARMTALRIRNSKSHRSSEENQLDNMKTKRRRLSMEHAYARNMDRAEREIQTACMDLKTQVIKNLFHYAQEEMDEFEATGKVPRGLELQVSFARQRRSKVSILKFLQYQKKFKNATSNDIPKGYTVEDVLSSAMMKEGKESRDCALDKGHEDFAEAWPCMSEAIGHDESTEKAPVETLSTGTGSEDDLCRLPKQQSKNPQRIVSSSA